MPTTKPQGPAVALLAATGVANLYTVESALRRAGAEVSQTRDADTVAKADYLVVPGVGSFGAAMDGLRESSTSGAGDATALATALADRIERGRPTLAICLGMQLLGQTSEETPGVPGLGITDGAATRFPEQLDEPVPNIGWHKVRPSNEEPRRETDKAANAPWFYFAHSYRWTAAPLGWQCAWARYGSEPFVAAVRRGAVIGCQFHPELSSAAGLRLIQDWLQLREENTPCFPFD